MDGVHPVLGLTPVGDELRLPLPYGFERLGRVEPLGPHQPAHLHLEPLRPFDPGVGLGAEPDPALEGPDPIQVDVVVAGEVVAVLAPTLHVERDGGWDPVQLEVVRLPPLERLAVVVDLIVGEADEALPEVVLAELALGRSAVEEDARRPAVGEVDQRVAIGRGLRAPHDPAGAPGTATHRVLGDRRARRDAREEPRVVRQRNRDLLASGVAAQQERHQGSPQSRSGTRHRVKS